MKNDKYLDKLVDHLFDFDKRSDIKKFLEAILTPAELGSIPVRLEIIKRLKKGEPQHKIAKDLSIGVATVTRGAREIKKGNFSSVK